MPLRPLHLDQSKTSDLGDMEIMPIAVLRFCIMIENQQNVCCVCVVGSSTDSISARAEALINLLSQIAN
jgi:hypothetical protein